MTFRTGAPGELQADSAPLARQAPGLARRLAALIYEGVLLFGVLMAAGLLFATLTQQRHALHGKAGLQAFVVIVLAAYFSGFWSHGGQTVAMKAWQIRLVRADGTSLSPLHALLRFFLAWLWFLPAWATAHLAGFTSIGALTGMTVAGVLAFAALSWLRPDCQFWHDVVCGTRLIDWQPVRKPPVAARARQP